MPTCSEAHEEAAAAFRLPDLNGHEDDKRMVRLHYIIQGFVMTGCHSTGAATVFAGLTAAVLSCTCQLPQCLPARQSHVVHCCTLVKLLLGCDSACSGQPGQPMLPGSGVRIHAVRRMQVIGARMWGQCLARWCSASSPRGRPTPWC